MASNVRASHPEESPVLSQLVKCRVRLQNSERGATAVEYGLMVALIAIVIIGAVTLLGGNLSSLFNAVATSV
jgi:pilus assembly protein Flp/PilA